MRRTIIAWVLVLGCSTATDVVAQVGDGSLRGVVKDEQGAAMPGVTITATSPALISPSVAVSEGNGAYRVINLPPGTYALTAELAGFSVFRREGILLRAGANFQVDITMALGTLEETVTVSGDSPMIEVARPSNVLNIDAQFQKALPLVEGKYWSDFLHMTPGVMSRPHNDGSGRQNYFGNAVDHRDAVVDMEGMMASNYNDSNINRTALSTEAVEDVQIKTGGVDAASPMGYGLVLNMISKSGGNQLSGSGGWTYQPFEWNGDNTGGRGTPATRAINQADFSVGGPAIRDRVWFFGAYRWQNNETTPSRIPAVVAALRALYPNQPFEDTTLKSTQPYVKVTARLGANHTLAGIYQGDRLHMLNVGQTMATFDEVLSTGGGLYGGKLTSVWGKSLTTTFTASYNNKGGNGLDSYDGRVISGPSIDVHPAFTIAQGRATGTGLLVTTGGNRSVGCLGCMLLDNSSVTMVRGDVTWFKDDLAGSHEFQFGFLALPRNNFDQQTVYLNDGFIYEQQRLRDPNSPAAGTVPFHRQYITGSQSLLSASGRDKDIGFYVQDTWKTASRLTLTLGVRVDLVRRFDSQRGFARQSSTEVGPRVGFSYLLTTDAKNVLRGTFARVHEQLQGGRHGVSSFGGADAAAVRDTYDLDGNGSFETVFDTPARTSTLSAAQFDPGMSQPIIDEYIAGYRRQFPGQISVDVAGIYRKVHNMFAQTDINGFYPDGPNRPFGGFGRVDPNQGIVYRLTNADWHAMHYQALQVTLAKNLSNNFQALVAIHRQWQQDRGTWNPTDPARFIQPDAFPNNRMLWRTRDPNDHNSYPGSTTAPMWNPFSYRFNATWHAPYGIVTAGSYSVVSGGWSSWIVRQLPANDPQIAVFGPSTVVSSTGSRQSNPLATRIRFVYPTRGEGQVLLAATHTVGLKLSKRFRLGGSRDFEVATNILNLLNGGRGTEYARGGANRQYNTVAYLQPGNLQAARSFQLDVLFRF
ncbi:MAG: TonB-dependent receptor domain-containing protein [Acidobacteriota bacterium]